jgi:hypothetical protein
MSESLHLTLVTPEQATRAVSAQLVPFCRALWQDGERVSLVAQREEDARSLQQNAFMWGFVLKTISAQAVIDGIGADENGWHLYFKRRLLGYKVVQTKLPGKKRKSITRELRSTTDLKQRRRGDPDPAKYMTDYLDAVMAIAATEFGVTFDADKRWEDWRA